MKADTGYAARDPLRVALVEIGGIRSVLSVPTLKENALLGIFNVYSEKVGLYSDKHVALVKNFAAQAVRSCSNAGHRHGHEAHRSPLLRRLSHVCQ